ncbi:hypothetical protein ACI2KS_10565 [Pseudomonas sp. NPDC087358]|uniref:hypothetical protein n=1 Tax=Pseudomonas sp. NPDC087358 TaxID=3364439 RepID=UPI00384B28C2
MRAIIIVLLGLIIFPACADDSAKSFLVNLRGSAAKCAITGSSGATSAFLVGRDHGTSSKKYQAALQQAYAEAKACVDDEKPKMKPLIKAEIEDHPDLRDVTLDAYAKWMSYMDWLSTPHDWATDSREEAAFEQAANRLQAEMDIR